MGVVLMEVPMDVFVGQFGCFLPMTRAFDEPSQAGPWRSSFADDEQDHAGSAVFDDILAAVRPLYED